VTTRSYGVQRLNTFIRLIVAVKTPNIPKIHILRFLDHTQLDIQPVGLLLTSDGLVA